MIPGGVKTIGNEAFYSCNSLTSITIPSSVKLIDTYAFWSCNNLSDIYYTGTETEWRLTRRNNGNDCLLDAKVHLNYVPAEASGRCGDNLYWDFKGSTGNLIIEGSGEMYVWEHDSAPWYYICKKIKTVIIESYIRFGLRFF